MDSEFLTSLRKDRQGSGSEAQLPLVGLSPGSRVVLRICDRRTVHRSLHFRGKGKQPIICPESECPVCDRGKRPVSCDYVNVYDCQEERVKVLYVCGTLRQQLGKCVEQYGQPTEYDIMITRSKMRGHNQYNVEKAETNAPLPSDLSLYPLEQRLKPATREELEALFDDSDLPL